MITILFFGPVAERVGASRLEIGHADGMRLRDLQAQLQRRYPQAFEIVSIVAVNGARAHDDAMPLADRSEVVFMSKFSGG
jgi:molybdopterin converting factor small subunit